jgi:hypothetical protein
MHLQILLHSSPTTTEPLPTFSRPQSHFLSHTKHTKQNLESQNYSTSAQKFFLDAFFAMLYRLLTELAVSPQTLTTFALSAIRLKMMLISSSFANYLNRSGLL